MNDLKPISQRMLLLSGGIGIAFAILLLLFSGLGIFAALIIGAIVAAVILFAMMVGLLDALAGDDAPIAAPPATPSTPDPVETPAPAPKVAPEPADAPEPVVSDGKPTILDAARIGGADDLKKIKGVGPKLEAVLNDMGFYHYDQIAAWGAAEQKWVDENLPGFKGRATRDKWVEQAKTLAASA